MKKNACFSARVVITALLILSCCIITSLKAEPIFTGQRMRIKPHKESTQKTPRLCIPKPNKLNNTKKSIIKKLYSTSIDNSFFNRLHKLPFKNLREFPIQKMRVRKDIDYKILSMHVRKDIDYKILNITP